MDKNTWIKRVKTNLLPLSEEKENIVKAIQEWKYFGEPYDQGSAHEICELCDQVGLRYQFKIVNILTHNTLLVGSECITKFEIVVIDESGAVLQGEEAKKKVSKDKNKLITDAKFRGVINTLVKLKAKDDQFEIDSFIRYYEDRKAFTPDQLSLLIWRLKEHKLEYNKNHIKMTIERNIEKEQLLKMDQWKISKLWPCLSSYQKKFLKDKRKIDFTE